jgi:hypothetical protein
MKKLLLIVIAFFVFMFPGNVFSGSIDNFETLTVLTSAVKSFTTANIEDVTKGQQNALSVFCTVLVANINYTFDGTTPTTGDTGVGHRGAVGTWFKITGHARIKAFQAIAATATSTVTCTYSFAD